MSTSTEGFPAGAGMDHPAAGMIPGMLRFPRRRGDGPPAKFGAVPSPEFPPQARGWTVTEGGQWQGFWSFPPQARG